MQTLEKDYNDLKRLHKFNVQKLHNVQKKIGRIRKDTKRLQDVADELLDTNMRNGFKLKLYKKRIGRVDKDDFSPRSFREKVDYAVKCIDWLRKNNIRHKKSFSRTSTDDIIRTCHKLYHDHLLNAFTFTLGKECSQNGCMSWTYGHIYCHCGKTQIFYDKKDINYNYQKDVHIEDKHPLYKISFYANTCC